MLNNPINRAITLINGSRYIRLITPNGVSRISRAIAIQSVYDTVRCADCIGGREMCAACMQHDTRLEIQGHFIHLDGYGRPGILHV
jgi:hypothetical protein